jgi:UDP-N-acetylglucosamine 2-epimerase (non-hydrolysing)
MKVLSIFGTRPEAIKMAPVIHELARHPRHFTSRVCVTAQHREMLDQVLALFDIQPDYDLGVMRPEQTLTDVAAAVIRGLDEVLRCERPDWILVQGDTTTTMAASLAAFHRRISVGHVEAGLRTFDKYRPYPEEINRRITTVLADLHFAPTRWAAGNLEREGVAPERILTTGNTVIDALRRVAALPFDPRGTPLEGLRLGQGPLLLITAHRRESFGQGMREICRGLRMLALQHPEAQLVWPVHLNPAARQPAHEHLGTLPNVTLLPPLEYQALVWLLQRAYFVITDSGGLQEEAPGLGKPVLVLRETTERPEGVEAGTVRLIGVSAEALVAHAHELLTDPAAYQRMSSALNPYGSGDAALQIIAALRAHGTPEGTDRRVETRVPAALTASPREHGHEYGHEHGQEVTLQPGMPDSIADLRMA